MTDITQHEWSDPGVYGCMVDADDGDILLIESRDAEGAPFLSKKDSIALAEHFGLLPAIKPLEWEGEIKEEFDAVMATTTFGSFRVSMTEDRGFRWEYCFDEYHDEDEAECESEADGRAKAEAYWRERVGEVVALSREVAAPRWMTREEFERAHRAGEAGASRCWVVIDDAVAAATAVQVAPPIRIEFERAGVRLDGVTHVMPINTPEPPR